MGRKEEKASVKVKKIAFTIILVFLFIAFSIFLISYSGYKSVLWPIYPLFFIKNLNFLKWW